MTMRRLLILTGCVGVLAGGAVGVAIGARSMRPHPEQVEPPEIGGQSAPAVVRQIDFGKRYDVHCSFFKDEPTVFRGCKVVGFTGRDVPGTEERSSFSSSSSRIFDRWLVLELSDGRLAYVPPTALKYLESAPTP
jgi:hypothetical protein